MAREMQQGEDFEDEEKVNGPEEDVTHSSKKTADNKKVLLIVGLIVLFFIIVLIMFMIVKSKTNTDTADSSGDEQIDASALLQQAQATPAYSESTEEPAEADITDSEALELRKYGYTGDEIEQYRNQGLDYDTLIQEATKEKEEVAREYIKSLSSEGSEEYQRLMNLTWLCGDPIDLQAVQPNEYGDLDITYETKIINADYTKCGAQGNQLFLKLDLGDMGSAFMYVEPQRWVSLNDSGNIVVSADICHYSNVSVITSIVEVDTGDHPEGE